MDKLASMEIFVGVVEAGSLTAAAERAGISAAMAGKHVKALEIQLGTRLLTRTTRTQSLTEIGREYYERCRQILADVKDADAVAEAMTTAPRGVLKVTAPLTYGVEVFAPAITAYLDACPEVSVELDLSNRIIDLVDEGFDAAIRIGPLADSGLVGRPLAPYRVRAVAAPAYLARAGVPRTPADLERHECLGLLHSGKEGGWRFAGAELPVAPRGRFRATSAQALREAALQGFGIAMQPEALFARELASGALVPVLDAYMPAPSRVHLLYPRDRRATPKLTSFVEFVVGRLGA
ncbi:LysR family transcriptional regulator [Burkholderia sp. FERM BP-3421]|uniref:LysR family transcriptional regulator n=1 Tax=Burkholderia sp. FERM BP-3421 TaxID=1494466 RepID=UPI0023623031|nr:LysR family transcriptional regulator [Burkholderia sp. FERM BP-3421]WDD94085.1 LysR family transcriptional regulator [Burkholderia sp. FERM BP-3421]